jgi:hypothetical protein
MHTFNTARIDLACCSIIEAMTEAQLERYEAFRRSGLPRPKMKKVWYAVVVVVVVLAASKVGSKLTCCSTRANGGGKGSGQLRGRHAGV